MTLIRGISLVICHGLCVSGAESEYGGVGGAGDGSFTLVRGVGGELRTTQPGGGSGLKEVGCKVCSDGRRWRSGSSKSRSIW